MKQQEVSKKLYLDCKAEGKNDLESNDHSNYDIQHHIIGKSKKIYEQIQTKFVYPLKFCSPSGISIFPSNLDPK